MEPLKTDDLSFPGARHHGQRLEQVLHGGNARRDTRAGSDVQLDSNGLPEADQASLTLGALPSDSWPSHYHPCGALSAGADGTTRSSYPMPIKFPGVGDERVSLRAWMLMSYCRVRIR